MLKLSALLLLASSVSAFAQSGEGGFGIVTCPPGSKDRVGCIPEVDPKPIVNGPTVLNGVTPQANMAAFTDKNAQAIAGATANGVAKTVGP